MTVTNSESGQGVQAGAVSVALATLFGNLFLVLGSLFFGTLSILTAWIPPRGDWVYFMARLWSRGLLLSSGIRLTVSAGSRLDPSGRFVFMSNHQSLYDIPALIQSLPGQARFLAKRSLFQIPIFGWALKAGGFVSIDRKDRSRAAESFAEAVARLRSGASAVVFPEGTRSLDGHLLPFERGGFLLAIKSGTAIVPVGIAGSLQVRSRDSWIVRPGRIEVRYGAPIDVRQFGIRGRAELSELVRAKIAELAYCEE
ncbi:MAG: lysophospholipid acyltransferase family protein [Acidobacteriota bacterium]